MLCVRSNIVLMVALAEPPRSLQSCSASMGNKGNRTAAYVMNLLLLIDGALQLSSVQCQPCRQKRALKQKDNIYHYYSLGFLVEWYTPNPLPVVYQVSYTETLQNSTKTISTLLNKSDKPVQNP